MQSKITTIQLPLPYRLGSVNCYLIEAGDAHVLIDTGSPHQRVTLEKELERAGCKPGSLKLILITHGDLDHTGNAASIRGKFAAKVAMHPQDWGMVERGDMFSGRAKGNFLLRSISPLFFGFGKAERFTPDIALTDGCSLREYELEAQVLSVPGHSRGSIAILTDGGDLFCGDLLENTARPAFNSLMDDWTAGIASLQRLNGLSVTKVYPGHGASFGWEAYPEILRSAQRPVK